MFNRPNSFLATVAVALLVTLSTTGTAQSADDECGVYAAALNALAPDSSFKTLVVYDSVSLATPSFAFHGWTGIGLPKADSKVPLTYAVWESIRATYREREALPACFGKDRSVIRVPYDSLMAPFKNRQTGWDDFGKVFPGALGFHVVGRPYFTNEQRSESLVYIAHAGHWLSGSGRVVYLKKVQGQWQVIASHALWLS